MANSSGPRKRLDLALLAEMILALALLAAAVFLFWIPASREPFIPRWWSVPLLIALFFGLLALHRWRKREHERESLHEAVREVVESDEAHVTHRDDVV